jgi:hypothetical protein
MLHSSAINNNSSATHVLTGITYQLNSGVTQVYNAIPESSVTILGCARTTKLFAGMVQHKCYVMPHQGYFVPHQCFFAPHKCFIVLHKCFIMLAFMLFHSASMFYRSASILFRSASKLYHACSFIRGKGEPGFSSSFLLFLMASLNAEKTFYKNKFIFTNQKIINHHSQTINQ